MPAGRREKSPKKPRSVDLPPNVKKMLAKHVASFEKPVDAAVAIGLDRNTMQRINEKGSGSPDKVQIVTEFFEKKTKRA